MGNSLELYAIHFRDEVCSRGQTNEVKVFLADKSTRVDCLDDHGMTPLQHAAYRANMELCELLLSHGADVNSNEHDSGYTALMFAALSGNVEVTKLMLCSGARIDHTNSVGRTASQMAGFVGQNQVVALINHFFSLEDLEYYTKPQGLEKEPKLPPILVKPLHRMCLIPNLHPVKLSLYLKEHTELLAEANKVIKVLELESERQMKQSQTNEIMGIKMHYFSHIVKQCSKAMKEKGSLDNWIKGLIKQRDDDMFPEYQEKFIRSTLKDYPYVQSSTLLQQMIMALSQVDIGDSPTGLSTLEQSINGQHLSDEIGECDTCGEPKAIKKCTACKKVNYCNQNCQKLQWFSHKKFCKKLAEKYKEEQDDLAKHMEAEKTRIQLEQANIKEKDSSAVGQGDSISSGHSKTDEATTSQNKAGESGDGAQDDAKSN